MYLLKHSFGYVIYARGDCMLRFKTVKYRNDVTLQVNSIISYQFALNWNYRKITNCRATLSELREGYNTFLNAII